MHLPLSFRLHDDFVLPVTEAFCVVAWQTVCRHRSSARDVCGGELPDGGFIIVFGVGEADPAVGCFGRDEDHRLSPARAADVSFIDLNVLAKRLALRSDQRDAQFVQPRPGRFVRTKPHDALQILGRNAIATRADLEHRSEPRLERFACAGQDRAGCQARLMAAFRALKQRAAAFRPNARAVAFMAGRLPAPSRLDPKLATVFLGRKPFLELNRRPREIPPKLIVALI